MVLTDELCDRLCAAAREKSRELGAWLWEYSQKNPSV